MNSEVEQQFSNYDWSSNSSWQAYLENLYPPPAGSILEKVKRKWFKKNVNPSLEVETASTSSTSNSNPNFESSGTHQRQTGESQRQEQSNQNNSGAQSSSEPNAGSSSGGFLSKIGSAIGGVFGKIFTILHKVIAPMKEQLYTLEGFLKIFFIFSALLLPGYANMIAFIICLLGFFRRTGKPQWNAEYGRLALENEFLQNLFYMVPFVFFPGQKNLMYFLPLAIHFWIGIAEFFQIRYKPMFERFKKYLQFTVDNKRNLMYQKARVEIILFGFLIFMLIFGGSNLLILIFYGNFLKTKWMLSSVTKTAFSDIDNWVQGKMAHPYFPGFAKFIVEKIRAFCRYMVKM